MRRHAANLVSALRLVLTPPFVWAVCQGPESAQTWLAPILFAIIAASDLVDGRLARALGTVSDGGRLLDHGSDIAFVLSAFGAYAWTGVAPWWVPTAVAAAFGAYVIDSWRSLPHARPARGVGNRLGHLGGVLNWVVIGVLVGNETVALRLLSPTVLYGLFYMVLAYSIAPVVIRVVGVSELDRKSSKG